MSSASPSHDDAFSSHFSVIIDKADNNLCFVPSYIGGSQWKLEWGATHCSIIGPAGVPDQNGNTQGNRRYLSLFYEDHSKNINAIQALFADFGTQDIIIAQLICKALLREEFVFFQAAPHAANSWHKLFQDPFLKFLRAYARFNVICQSHDTPPDPTHNRKIDELSCRYNLKQKIAIALEWSEELLARNGSKLFLLAKDVMKQELKSADGLNKGELTVRQRSCRWIISLVEKCIGKSAIEEKLYEALASPSGKFVEDKNGNEYSQIKKEWEIICIKAVNWALSRNNRRLACRIEVLKGGLWKMSRVAYWVEKFFVCCVLLVPFLFYHLIPLLNFLAQHLAHIPLCCRNACRHFIDVLVSINLVPGQARFHPHWNGNITMCILFSLVLLFFYLGRTHKSNIIVGVIIGFFFLAQADVLLKSIVIMPYSAPKIISIYGKKLNSIIIVYLVDVILMSISWWYLRARMMQELFLHENEAKALVFSRSLLMLWYGFSVSLVICHFVLPLIETIDSMQEAKDKILSIAPQPDIFGGTILLFDQPTPVLAIIHWSVLAFFICIFFQVFWQDKVSE